MSLRNERFNRSMRSLEAMIAGMSDPSKSAKLSDRCENAARMYAALEPEQDAPDRDQELAGADIFNAQLPCAQLGVDGPAARHGQHHIIPPVGLAFQQRRGHLRVFQHHIQCALGQHIAQLPSVTFTST